MDENAERQERLRERQEQRQARLQARRRARARREFDSSVPSPCILVCQLDPKSGFCLGCARSADEIREWMILSAAEKRAILERLPGRKAEAEWRSAADALASGQEGGSI